MTPDETDLMDRLVRTANERFDGHLTVLKFTTNWRVGFGTPSDASDLRDDITRMAVGATLAEAATIALANPRRMDG